MIYVTKHKDDIKDLDELVDLQSKVKEVRLVEKLGKHGFPYDIKNLFETITKTVTDNIQKILEGSKFSTKKLRHRMNQMIM